MHLYVCPVMGCVLQTQGCTGVALIPTQVVPLLSIGTRGYMDTAAVSQCDILLHTQGEFRNSHCTHTDVILGHSSSDFEAACLNGQQLDASTGMHATPVHPHVIQTRP